ncbi:MAG: hypothetical protein ABWX76_00460, partial [Leifsonia flava]
MRWARAATASSRGCCRSNWRTAAGTARRSRRRPPSTP